MRIWVRREAVYRIRVGTKAIEGKIWISGVQVSNVDLLFLWSTSWCKGTMVRGHTTFIIFFFFYKSNIIITSYTKYTFHPAEEVSWHCLQRTRREAPGGRKNFHEIIMMIKKKVKQSHDWGL